MDGAFEVILTMCALAHSLTIDHCHHTQMLKEFVVCMWCVCGHVCMHVYMLGGINAKLFGL